MEKFQNLNNSSIGIELVNKAINSGTKILQKAKYKSYFYVRS